MDQRPRPRSRSFPVLKFSVLGSLGPVIHLKGSDPSEVWCKIVGWCGGCGQRWRSIVLSQSQWLSIYPYVKWNTTHHRVFSGLFPVLRLDLQTLTLSASNFSDFSKGLIKLTTILPTIVCICKKTDVYIVLDIPCSTHSSIDCPLIYSTRYSPMCNI